MKQCKVSHPPLSQPVVRDDDRVHAATAVARLRQEKLLISVNVYIFWRRFPRAVMFVEITVDTWVLVRPRHFRCSAVLGCLSELRRRIRALLSRRNPSDMNRTAAHVQSVSEAKMKSF